MLLRVLCEAFQRHRLFEKASAHEAPDFCFRFAYCSSTLKEIFLELSVVILGLLCFLFCLNLRNRYAIAGVRTILAEAIRGRGPESAAAAACGRGNERNDRAKKCARDSQQIHRPAASSSYAADDATVPSRADGAQRLPPAAFRCVATISAPLPSSCAPQQKTLCGWTPTPPVPPTELP